MNIIWRTFSELRPKELYSILELRQRVFMLEQNCLYPDIDGKDVNAMHLLISEENTLCAYLRLFPPQILQDARFDANSLVFGRVVVNPDYRSSQLGKLLMKTLLDYCDLHFPSHAIECSAQAYLKKFYSSFGFVIHSQDYDEDGILHADMILRR